MPSHGHRRLVSALAQYVEDPDWDCPLTLKEGVPLGVTDPTRVSPGIWPSKDELTGEDHDPQGFFQSFSAVAKIPQPRTSPKRFSKPSKRRDP